MLLCRRQDVRRIPGRGRPAQQRVVQMRSRSLSRTDRRAGHRSGALPRARALGAGHRRQGAAGCAGAGTGRAFACAHSGQAHKTRAQCHRPPPRQKILPMTEHFDTLETRAPEARERDQFAALRRQIAHASSAAPAFKRLLADVDVAGMTSRDALAHLPVTRKSDLLELQKADRPFGGFAATGWGAMRRVFASPGPIYEPEGARPDHWRLARALFAAGFRAGDLVHNCFSYHLTPAGSMLETAAHALGCTVFPGGTGQTELQVQAIADLKPAGYVGTPSFLKIILEKADEQRIALPSLNKALLSAEAFPPSLRDAFARRGIHGYQVYASADLGTIASETSAR